MGDDLDLLPEFEDDDEPLFADDLDDPPPLPPPLQGIESSTNLSSTDDNLGLRVGLGLQGQGTDQQAGDRRRRRDADGEEGEDGGQPVKKMRRPVPTLTVDRLFSDRGIPYLVSEFPKKKFKGKGHEASDLKNLLLEYERWANALFPKLTFHDFIKRVEAIGSSNKDFKARFSMLRRRAGGLAPLEGDEELEASRDEETRDDQEEGRDRDEETTRDDQEEDREANREAEEESEETRRDETNGQEAGREELNREEEDYQSMLFDTADDEEFGLLRELDENFGGDQNEPVDDYNADLVRRVEETNGTSDE